MNRLFIMDMKNYDSKSTRFKRPSVRGIIIKDNKVAMVHSLKYDYYKFPGGGIEKNESHIEALVREVREETGLVVKKDSISEFGSVLRVQKSVYNENEIFEQENFYYRCEVEEVLSEQQLDDYENKEQFTLEFVAPEYAISVNRTHEHGGYDSVLIEREAKVLSIIKSFIGEI